jgi:hypothetical protein
MSDLAKSPSSDKTKSYFHTSIDATTVDKTGVEKHTKIDDECQLQLTQDVFASLKTQLTNFLVRIKNDTIEDDVKEVKQAIEDFKTEFTKSVELINADIAIAEQHLLPLGTTTVRSINSDLKLKTIVKPIKDDVSNINNKLQLFNTSRFFTRKGATHGPEQIVNEFEKKIGQKYENSKIVRLENITGHLIVKNLITRKITFDGVCTVVNVNTFKKEYTVTYQPTKSGSKLETVKVANNKVCLVT